MEEQRRWGFGRALCETDQTAVKTSCLYVALTHVLGVLRKGLNRCKYFLYLIAIRYFNDLFILCAFLFYFKDMAVNNQRLTLDALTLSRGTRHV